jgi:HEAT repeats
MTPLVPRGAAQPSESIASLLLRFDNEHDYAQKERLLRDITSQFPDSGPALLRLAQSTNNTDTRWMAMRGMATLHYTACAPFLEAPLKDLDAAVRTNAARASGDLRIKSAAAKLLAMFAAEQEPGAVEQASLALRMLDIKAAAPYVREKIPRFTGQTRSWLLQALGSLGSDRDVPLIAGYLDDMGSELQATWALEELAGVSFGPTTVGASSFPPAETLIARSWWTSHKDQWPRCDDCRHK